METLLLCNAKALCIPGGTKGEMSTQNMHIHLSESRARGGRMPGEERGIFRLKDVESIVNLHAEPQGEGLFPCTYKGAS